MKEWNIEESDYGDEYWFGGPGQGCIEVGGWVNGGCKHDDDAWEELKKEAILIAAAPEMLEALQECAQIDNLHRQMHRIEKRRNRGSFGIAVSDDEDAIEWQKLSSEVEILISKRNAAIAKATGD